MNVTFALMDTSHRQLVEYERQELVAALTFGAFSRGKAPDYDAEALATLRAAAPDASVLGDGVAIRKVLNALALKQDGTPAAEATVIRKRATLHNLLQFAVDAGVIMANPLKTIKRSGPRIRTTVDPRVVINQKQGKALLAGVKADHPHLRAYFALMLFAGLRPAEARNVRRRDLELPDEGWGWVLLHSTAQVSGSAWTNDGQATEQRPLKHRSQSETRRVPLNKRAVKILRTHLDTYPCGPDGHLFVSRTGKAGKPLSPPYTSLVSVETIGRAWSRARITALSPEQVDSVLARRPYDLRHARLTWWLNAGVPPTQVAKWAGHSVRVLLDVYAGCVDGGEKQALSLLSRD